MNGDQTDQRVAYRFMNFAQYRIRPLLYAGRPSLDLLPSTITPRLTDTK